jgi:hypothetical protein
MRVLLNQQTQVLMGNGRVERLKFVSGEELEAELVSNRRRHPAQHGGRSQGGSQREASLARSRMSRPSATRTQRSASTRSSWLMEIGCTA